MDDSVSPALRGRRAGGWGHAHSGPGQAAQCASLPFTWLTPPGPPALCLLGSSSRKPSWKPSQGVRLGVPRGTCLIPGLSLQIMTVSPVTFDMSMTWVCHGCLWNARMSAPPELRSCHSPPWATQRSPYLWNAHNPNGHDPPSSKREGGDRQTLQRLRCPALVLKGPLLLSLGRGWGYVVSLLPGTGTSQQYFVRYCQLLRKTMGQPDSGNRKAVGRPRLEASP